MKKAEELSHRTSVSPARTPQASSCRELACYYFPSVRPEASVRKMKRWLNSDPEMLRALRSKGYRNGQRRFTRAQVKVFVRYLGT
ncbi:MAG: DUF4248 domain-containing protein [Alloprevotella sp.]|nr:DUF4248 domain-containing protein [Alloprevotella sp.]